MRALEDLPGLFDEILADAKEQDTMTKIINEHRSKQTSAHKGVLEMDFNSGKLALRRQLQFISFGSGSSGNSAYIGVAGEGGVLIDAGVDADKVIAELKRNCIPEDKIFGIILTHDHGDHVKYAYSLLRKLPKMLIYSTVRTLEGMLRRHSISRRIKDFHKPVFKEFAIEIGPFVVTPFEVSHDGTDNVGFCLSIGDMNFVIATDMGIITERADFYIRKANWLMIESNYDEAMLTNGSYPDYLKARIRSERGHLNNIVTATYLASIWKDTLSDIYLCHLSHDNNRPEIALNSVKEAMMSKGIRVGDASGSIESRSAQVHICALPRFESSPLFLHRI